jgi:hypothetical protein
VGPFGDPGNPGIGKSGKSGSCGGMPPGIKGFFLRFGGIVQAFLTAFFNFDQKDERRWTLAYQAIVFVPYILTFTATPSASTYATSLRLRWKKGLLRRVKSPM